MSGIYGFTYRAPDQQLLTDTLGALEYWNRIYGREEHRSQLFSDSCIGCYVEHFSDQFPYGGPILDYNGCPSVVDALLYNRDELFAQLHLEEAVHPLSDEELLLRWIEVKGFDALSQVNGDFAGAIFDPNTSEWILFRDHMGVRPLYYYLDEGCFAFSTDLRGLAAMPEADTGIDEMQFYIQVSGTNSLSMQDTDFERIKCILPAAVTRVKKTAEGFGLSEQTYWTLCQKRIRFSTDEEYRQELRRLITDAVHRRCDAISGLLGGELSGGLDSTVIDVLIARYGREAKFFSWSPDLDSLPMSEGEDERRTILEVCARERIECHFMGKEDVAVFKSSVEHLLPSYIDTVPLGIGSAWLRSQGARVVFTGHGGDEGVSHRGRRHELLRYREYRTYFNYYRQDLAGRPLGLFRALRAACKDARADRRSIKNSPAFVRNHTELFTEEFACRMDSRFVPQEFTFNYDPHAYVLQGGTRPRMDNTAYQGAFHGVRYLFPYVDYRVMDFALSIPRRQFVGYEMNRLIFREAFRDLLPDNLYRKTYKYQASTHHLADQVPDRARYCAQVEELLGLLDQHIWDAYLDFDKLRVKLLGSDGKAGGIGSVDSLLDYLYHCTLIQNVQKNAKRWREFDEQDKTV